jgi:hypothetical protein
MEPVADRSVKLAIVAPSVSCAPGTQKGVARPVCKCFLLLAGQSAPTYPAAAAALAKMELRTIRS